VGGAGSVDPALSPSPARVPLFLDGQACTLLQTGLSRSGPEWTVSVHAQCRDEVNVTIRGRYDVHYPQTDLVPFRGQPAVSLELLRGDGRPTTAMFSTATEGSQVRLGRGPTSGANEPIVGKATLTENREVHQLAFELRYDY
jgi:hypothetical protein